MKKSLILTLHELKLYVQDKSDLAFSLILPVAVFALMYFGFGGDSMFHGTAYVVNNDQGGTYSTELLDRLGSSENIEIEYYTAEEAEVHLDRSDVVMVLYIPEGFSENIEEGQSAELLFKQRGNGGQEGQIIASIVSGIAGDINLDLQAVQQVSGALEGSGIAPVEIETVVSKYLQEEDNQPVISVKETTIGSSPDVINQYLPGVINMFVLFSISLSARMIVEERKRGTLERLLTSQISIGGMFAGKFLANVTRGFVQTLILLALAYAVFQLFTPVSFLSCLLIALVFAGAASGIGMIIAAIARTEDAATWIGVFFTMAMVMLGGTFFELAEGSVLYTISRFSIVTYANDAFRTIIAQNGTIGEIGMELGIMVAVFVAGLVISRLLFKIIPVGK